MEHQSSVSIPKHPVTQLQGPFEESVRESLVRTEDDHSPRLDAAARRKHLLDSKEYERVCAGRWKKKPDERYHPIYKIISQLSFGVHLLANDLAKSNETVISILHAHVNEVDEFLERITEDFDLAQSDINERIRHLSLPLENSEVFDSMLQDWNYRVTVIEGNDRIEHIVVRSTAAMVDGLKDIQKGLHASRALGQFLTQLGDEWQHRAPDAGAVFEAMVGNVQGWVGAFLELQRHGKILRNSLSKLGGIIADMQRRVSEASHLSSVCYGYPASDCCQG